MSAPGGSLAPGAASRPTARALLETRSVHFRPDDPFTLSSGLVSPTYVDCRRLIGFPAQRAAMMDAMAAMVPADEIDVVAGGETAGIPFAAWIAERMGLPMAYVRKTPKGHGRGARIEGPMEEGQRVLLVEDLTTDGGSKISFVDAIREAGGDLRAHRGRVLLRAGGGGGAARRPRRCAPRAVHLGRRDRRGPRDGRVRFGRARRGGGVPRRSACLAGHTRPLTTCAVQPTPGARSRIWRSRARAAPHLDAGAAGSEHNANMRVAGRVRDRLRRGPEDGGAG